MTIKQGSNQSANGSGSQPGALAVYPNAPRNDADDSSDDDQDSYASATSTGPRIIISDNIIATEEKPRGGPNGQSATVSGEQYRQSGATTAHETNSSDEEDGLTTAVPVDEEEFEERARRERERIMKDMVMVEGEVLSSKPWYQTKKYWIAALALAAVLVAIVVAAAVVSNNSNEDSSDAVPTQMPALSDEDYLQSVLSLIPTTRETLEALLEVENSPQALAFAWMLSPQNNNPSTGFAIQSMMDDVLKQRYALAVLYFSTQGDEWSVIQSSRLPFLLNTTVCEWKADEEVSRVLGVECDETGSVLRLNLDSIGLNGTIPEEIGDCFPGLQDLNLAHNHLTGTLPASLGNLQLLRHLEVGNNMLVGSIPESYSQLQQLEIFFASFMGLTGTLPQDILLIETLERFDVWGNSLNGTIPEIASGGPMEYLSLSRNSFTGPIPTSIYTLENIDVLALMQNQLTGPISNKIGVFGRAKGFYLNHNKFHGPIPTEVGQLTSCIHLWLAGNELTGAVPKEFADLAIYKNLETLNLFENEGLNGTIPEELGDLSSMRSFDISKTSIIGSLDPIFCNDSPIVEIRADCGSATPEVECSCCGVCFDDSITDGTGEPNLDQICAIDANLIMLPNVEPSWLSGIPIQDPTNATCECSDIPPPYKCIESVRDRSTHCGVYSLSCDDAPNCQVCNEAGTICGRQKNVGRTYQTSGAWALEIWEFEYTRGHHTGDVLRLEISRVDFYITEMFVNGEKCNSLNPDACSGGFRAFRADCSNIYPDAVYSMCSGFVEDAGVLHYLTPEMFQTPSTCL